MNSTRRSLRAGQRLVGRASSAIGTVARPFRAVGFPYRAPTVPRGVDVPRERPQLGANYDSEWARQPVASAARELIVEGPLRAAVEFMTAPEVVGLDRVADLVRLDDPPPAIFTPNHHSHLDTGLMISSIPRCWRRHLVVAAAADYFFDRHWKAALSALSLNAIPIDREVTSRRSNDQFRDLIADGQSLLIYPEGGRSPDGWGQSFKGGAAYLSARTGAPIIPVFIDGTGAIFGKGMKRPRRGETTVIFGAPLWPTDGENTRRYNARIEAAVTRLGDEALTDYWTATRRAASGTNPKLTGPDYHGWRRDWQLTERRRTSRSGPRVRTERAWPTLGS